MSSDYVPDADHIMRHVPYAKMGRDEETGACWPLWTAFELRADEEFLSATWLEYFSGSHSEQISQAIGATADGRTLGKKSGFAIGNVGNIKKNCEIGGARIRVTSEPVGNNLAHVALRRWPREEQELLAIIAADAWSEMVMIKDFLPA